MLFPQNDVFFQDFRWHESFLFFVSSPALQKRQENFEACWSVKKIWSPAGASRNFWSLLECYFLKMTFFQDFRWHESFFLFFVSSPALQKRQENFEACWSVKKIWSPAGASRNFWSLLECYFLKMTFFQDFRWHESVLFFVSSPALQKRQENFEVCWSVKKIWSPAGASRNFWSLLEFYFLKMTFFFKTLDDMKVFIFRF